MELAPKNSPNKFMVIIMVNNVGRSSSIETREITGNTDCDHIAQSTIEGKVTPSPPSPKSSPPTQQVTTNYPSPKPETPIPRLEYFSSCAEGSPCNSLITMLTNFGKITKSPPSPNPAPSKHHGTIEQPIKQSPEFQFKSIFPNFGKTPKSPPSPDPAPSKHQGTIEQPIQQRSSPPDFQFKSMSTHFGKTPKSPPSPNPAPSKHQGIIEHPTQQKSPPDFQIASF
ncbi:extensin-like isoform X2 [Durio zibethinus]|uniref:Extensin-like isoform X2 n=1 Tax=Durio zibethinus TaxID=66656 RepID=A0A6P5WZX4_DURZI|nr:extensin-like isoform X2 [Durio zibethinus]